MFDQQRGPMCFLMGSTAHGQQRGPMCFLTGLYCAWPAEGEHKLVNSCMTRTAVGQQEALPQEICRAGQELPPFAAPSPPLACLWVPTSGELASSWGPGSFHWPTSHVEKGDRVAGTLINNSSRKEAPRAFHLGCLRTVASISFLWNDSVI